MSRANKLGPEVNRALFVKNLSYNVTPEELFDLFGKYGPIRQVRQGIANNTKGTAFVVYEDVMDAKQACDKLNGYNFQNRYLVVLYHQPDKMMNRTKQDLDARKEDLEHGPADSLQSRRKLSGGPSSPTPSSATKHAASAPRAPKSSLKKGRPDITMHVRRMPHFVRKLLPTVPECA
ncbi:putative pre-mRNA branch site protein p14 [Achaetomium macrosporum]|uniref:Pre-mRNA branch site protein p14 n=1 Tax=Achaetomium macrosporum TaxID=79813 RepID=A0AAN7CF80_9PEZI|nr:putative pre-mRNA branch site protein p14 [Achaetomium macrosporum]